ncbi:MAG: hypothetical protein GXP46_13030 [Deferribacteres bacterium]|nr:hypothetical protein [Deferribacteres bacterium]
MNSTALMFCPIDVLYLRGNRLFGGPGDHGEALMPPWPSVFSGSVLSRAITDEGRLSEVIDQKNGPSVVAEMFGDFTIRWIALADENRHGSIFFPPPADLVVLKAGDTPEPVALATVKRNAFSGCASSLDQDILPEYAVLRTQSQTKPDKGYWLTLDGLKAHLAGDKFDEGHLIRTSELWSTDPRLGIALDSVTRTAEETRIYTTDTIVLAKGIGFLCLFSCEKGYLPADGLVRVGGDGRGAEIFEYPDAPSDLGRPQKGWQRFRMILATPCPSVNGWLPPVVKKRDDGCYIELDGFKARLVSAAVPRYEVISGWDVAIRKPKPAQRMIPAGSVFWFEVITGDTAELDVLWERGVISSKEYADRRRDGFGSVWFGRI